MRDNQSLLSTHLWDMRASLEAQVRCLTTVQRNVTEFHKTVDQRERDRLATTVLEDLRQIGHLSLAVIEMLQPTVEQASIELQ